MVKHEISFITLRPDLQGINSAEEVTYDLRNHYPGTDLYK